MLERTQVNGAGAERRCRRQAEGIWWRHCEHQENRRAGSSHTLENNIKARQSMWIQNQTCSVRRHRITGNAGRTRVYVPQIQPQPPHTHTHHGVGKIIWTVDIKEWRKRDSFAYYIRATFGFHSSSRVRCVHVQRFGTGSTCILGGLVWTTREALDLQPRTKDTTG